MSQQIESIIVLDISDGIIRSNMKKQDVIDYLKKHPEIKVTKSRKNTSGFSHIRMSYRNKSVIERVSAGFHEEHMISIDKNTYEYHVFMREPNV